MALPVRRLLTADGREIAHRLEIATDFLSRARGLLGRSSLPPGEGLLLEDCWNIHMFGMRFPIDVLYVDRELVVLKVRANLRPWRVSGCLGARSTIELGPGTLDRSPVERGSRLQLANVSDTPRQVVE